MSRFGITDLPSLFVMSNSSNSLKKNESGGAKPLKGTRVVKQSSRSIKGLKDVKNQRERSLPKAKRSRVLKKLLLIFNSSCRISKLDIQNKSKRSQSANYKSRISI
jgi:hypothetical protein